MTIQGALNDLSNLINSSDIPMYYKPSLKKIKETIELEMQPKTGEWIDKGYDIGNCWATCSECGKDARGYAKDTGWGHEYSFPNFCPHCGARMNGGGEK